MAQKDYTAERSDYMTPPSIYKTLLQIAGIEFFNTDVCCSRKNIPALHHCIDGERDGLQYPWHGPCFLNPPFKTAEKWVRRAVNCVKDNDHLTVYAVLPADRFETKYYQECILKNPHCCFAFLSQKIGFIIPGQENEEPKASQKIMIAIFSQKAKDIYNDWQFFGWFNTVAFLGQEYRR